MPIVPLKKQAAAARPGKHYFISLEIGRFLAAFLVAGFHASGSIATILGRYPFRDIFHGGHSGVEYFFLLSGFLIYSIHRQDFGKPGALRAFVLKRAIRILPMYWIVMSLYIAVTIAAPHMGEPRNLDPLNLIRNITMTSDDRDLYVGVAWTLKREAIFYGLFAVGLLLPRLRLGVFWFWQVAILAANLVHPEFSDGPRGDTFLGIYNLGFGLGALIAASLGLWKPSLLQAKLLFACGVVAFVAVFLSDWWFGAGLPHALVALGDHTSPFLYFAACWLIISGAVRYELVSAVPGRKWLRVLGDSSYVLYLFHEAFISTVIRILPAALPFRIDFAFVLALIAAVVGSAAIHLGLEAPLLRGLRTRLLPKRHYPVPAIS